MLDCVCSRWIVFVDVGRKGLLAEINDTTFDDFFVDPVETTPEGENKESSDASEQTVSHNKVQAKQMTVCPFCGKEHEV